MSRSLGAIEYIKNESNELGCDLELRLIDEHLGHFTIDLLTHSAAHAVDYVVDAMIFALFAMLALARIEMIAFPPCDSFHFTVMATCRVETNPDRPSNILTLTKKF